MSEQTPWTTVLIAEVFHIKETSNKMNKSDF